MTFLGPLSAAIAVAALATGGAGHVAAPGRLSAALRAHALVPERLVPVVAVAVPAVEVVLAVAVVVSALAGSVIALASSLAAAALLFATYAVYLRRIVATGRFVPCGCSMSDDPADGWAIARAVAFAVVAAIGAASSGVTLAAGLGVTETVVVACAASTLTLLLWRLPAAMRQPAGGAPRWIS